MPSLPPALAGRNSAFQSSSFVPFRPTTTIQQRCTRSRAAPSASCDPAPRAKPSRRQLLQALALTALTAPQAAAALCGEEDSFAMHYVPWKEVLSKTSSDREVRVRTVGKKSKQAAPLLLLTDAGVTLAVNEPLELLAQNRQLVELDYLGVGESTTIGLNSAPRETALDLAVDDVQAALRAAGVAKPRRLHVFAAGFGIAVAERMVNRKLPVTAVVAEAWHELRDPSLSALLGSRVCAVEAASDGNATIASAFGSPGALTSLQALSRVVPTLALRSAGVPAVPDAGPMLTDFIVGSTSSSEVRLPHLAASVEVLNAVSDFLDAQDGISSDGAKK